MSEIINTTPMTPVTSWGEITATPEYAADRIETLTNELARANERVEALRAREASAIQSLENFKESVTGLFRDKIDAGDLSRDTANEWLQEIGLDRITAKWAVEVTDDNSGDTILTVTGIEADDEDDAIEEVKDHLHIGATVVRVDFALDYDGEGDAEFEDSEPVWDDLEDEGDGYGDTFRVLLSFSATEE